MSEEWPNGWYRDEQGRRTQPGFTPRQDAQGSPYEPTQAGPLGGTAWPAQPQARSWPGDGGPPRTRGPRGRRPWLRPKRILIILATLVMVLALAGVGLYFDLNSKLSRVDVLAPAGFTSAGTNWLIAGSDSRGGLTRTEEDQLALGHDISGGRTDTIMLLHMPANGTVRRWSAFRETRTCRSRGTARTRSTPPTRSAARSC